MSDENPQAKGIQYQNMGVVDLTHIEDASQMVGAVIRNVGVVLVPQDHPDLTALADCQNVGAVVPVPKGTQVHTKVGQGELSWKVLAQYDEHTMVLVIGQYVITPPLSTLQCRALMVVGQVFVPKEGQSMFTSKITMEVGQVGQYTGNLVRVWTEDTRFDRAFLELLQEPTALVMFDSATFAADVSPDLLKAKVSSIASTDDIRVESPDLVALVRYLSVSHFGKLQVR